MNCLKVHDIYAYLEGDLSPTQRADVKDHLSACPKCREAVAERRLIAEVASGLPPLEVPADFAGKVMAKISPAKFRLPVWLIALTVSISSLALFLAFLVLSGKSLLASLSQLNNSLWTFVKNAAVFVGKSWALLSQLGTIIRSFLQVSAKGLSILTELISPEAQILIFTLTLVIFITLIIGLRKKIMIGE